MKQSVKKKLIPYACGVGMLACAVTFWTYSQWRDTQALFFHTAEQSIRSTEDSTFADAVSEGEAPFYQVDDSIGQAEGLELVPPSLVLEGGIGSVSGEEDHSKADISESEDGPLSSEASSTPEAPQEAETVDLETQMVVDQAIDSETQPIIDQAVGSEAQILVDQAVGSEAQTLIDQAVGSEAQTLIDQAVAQLYVYQSDFLSALETLYTRAKEAYLALPVEDRTSEVRESMMLSYAIEGSVLESNCDSLVQSLLVNLTSDLEKLGVSTEIVAEMKASYALQKAEKKAEYMAILED